MRLWHPTGVAELRLVRDSGWRRWPPRLPEQPIFYPVLSLAYAEKIARDWNAVGQGEGRYGFVTEFDVAEGLAGRYPAQVAGGQAHQELWVPAEDLDAFNDAILGPIRAITAYRDRVAYPLAEALREAGL